MGSQLSQVAVRKPVLAQETVSHFGEPGEFRGECGAPGLCTRSLLALTCPECKGSLAQRIAKAMGGTLYRGGMRQAHKVQFTPDDELQDMGCESDGVLHNNNADAALNYIETVAKWLLSVVPMLEGGQ